MKQSGQLLPEERCNKTKNILVIPLRSSQQRFLVKASGLALVTCRSTKDVTCFYYYVLLCKQQLERETDKVNIIWTTKLEDILDQCVTAGKLIFTNDYTGRPFQVAYAYPRALARGSFPYVTARSLGRV